MGRVRLFSGDDIYFYRKLELEWTLLLATQDETDILLLLESPLDNRDLFYNVDFYSLFLSGMGCNLLLDLDSLGLLAPCWTFLVGESYQSEISFEFGVSVASGTLVF